VTSYWPRVTIQIRLCSTRYGTNLPPRRWRRHSHASTPGRHTSAAALPSTKLCTDKRNCTAAMMMLVLRSSARKEAGNERAWFLLPHHHVLVRTGVSQLHSPCSCIPQPGGSIPMLPSDNAGRSNTSKVACTYALPVCILATWYFTHVPRYRHFSETRHCHEMARRLQKITNTNEQHQDHTTYGMNKIDKHADHLTHGMNSSVVPNMRERLGSHL
jgi:hypothetical protein